LPVHNAAMTTAHHRNATTIALLAVLAACTLNADVDVGLPEQRGEESSGSTGEPAQGVTGDEPGATGSTSDTAGSSGGIGGSGESSGSTGGAPECILPHDGSWCANQREVAQALGCRDMSDPWPCYQAIGAQYVTSEPQTVAAADCSTSVDGPECAVVYNDCTALPGDPGCLLMEPSVDACVALAEAAGMDADQALPWCEDMVLIYGGA
jgi:hypothetical protein